MKRTFVILMTFLLIFTLFPATSFAAQVDYPFAVEIILPENNIDQKGYYHVPGQPGEIIELQAKITNLTDQPIDVSAVPLNAYSGSDGIFYQSPESVNSQTFALIDENYGLAQYISTQEILTVVPKGEVIAAIRVAVPDITAGTLLGGIRFAVFSGTQQIETKATGSTTIVIDEYLAIDTAIQIDLPETAASSLFGGTPSFEGQQLQIPIANRSATIEHNVFGIYEVRDSNDSVLLMGSVTLPKMAPMTELRLLRLWDEAWQAGDYTLSMQLRANGQPLSFRQPFSIGADALPPVQAAEQSPQAAQKAVQPPATESSGAVLSQKFISGLVIGTPILISFIMLLLFKKKRKREKLIRNLAGKRYVNT